MTSGSQAAAGRGQGLAPRLIAAGVAAIIAAAFVLVAALAALGGGSVGVAESSSEAQSDSPSTLAEREIPPLYLRLYEQAAARYGLDWTILAGIGKVECDHGRAPSPSCTEEGAGQLCRRGRADAVPRLHVGAVRCRRRR